MKFDLKPFKHWIALGALLVVTLGFSSTREAHTLCWRWLLDLNGNTTVQGVPDGYGFHLIPSVQFTPEYQRLLESRATNSLEEFFLASAGDFQFASQAQPPRDEASPLLPAMVFRMVLRSSSTNSNALTPASMDSVRRMIQMARSSNPANGAFSQAEACFDFANNDPDAALRALWTSCSNRNWNACAAASFAGFSDLFERAGLSKLDAAVEAMRLEPLEGGYIPSRNCGYLDGMMIQAVQARKPQEFASLFQLLVELRRADWVDKSPQIYNHYRRYDKPSDDLVNAMALALGMNLQTNWLGYPRDNKVDLLIEQVFQNYLHRYANPVEVAVFNSQTESYQSENRLRELLDFSFPWAYWGQFLLEECAKVTGGVAMLMLSMLCFTLMYKVIRWRQVRSLGVWWRKTGFWLLSLVMFLLCLNIFSQFVHVIATGWDNELDPIEGFYLFSILFWIIITLLVFELIKWPRPKAQMNSWKVVHGFAVVYLMAIIAMGFFRSEVVAYYVAMYQ